MLCLIKIELRLENIYTWKGNRHIYEIIIFRLKL